jgi:hypothetical protein
MHTTNVVCGFVLLAACAKSSTTSPTTPPPASSEPVAQETPITAAEGTQRPSLTVSACESQGGRVVGDIGDGAIHRPDYRCPDSGKAPIGSIVPDPSGPIAVEGAVCCK